MMDVVSLTMYGVKIADWLVVIRYTPASTPLTRVICQGGMTDVVSFKFFT